MDEKQILENYYNSHDEDARLRSKHGGVEFVTTMHYIEKYLKKGDQIIEIGAGTGVYSHALARKGFKVQAVELSEHNISVFKANTTDGEKITITQGNALDLAFSDDKYDITLLLGPMYHLYTQRDQKRAIEEAVRITKRGGIIFIAYCGNDATAVQFLFGKHNCLKEPYLSLVDDATFKLSSTPEEIFALHKKEDIDNLLAGLTVKRLHFVGTDMFTNYITQSVDEMEDEEYEKYLKYVLATCEREDLVGASNHFLDILQKTE